ncbi:hypothetical protein Q5752_001991 [Cryptotrichosporon argae]
MPPRRARISAAASNATTPRASRTPSKPSTPRKTPAGRSGTTSPYFKNGKGVRGAGVKPEDDSGGEEGSEAKRGPTGLTETEDSGSSSDSSDSEDSFAPSDEDEAEEDMSSDTGEEDEDEDKETPGSKRRSVGTSSGGRESRMTKRAKAAEVDDEETEEDDNDTDLEEGQVVAGRIYPAPKIGQVPPGRISQNTLDFLGNLQVPERNDRDWFKSHEPAFRQAEKEWKDFVGRVQSRFAEADPEVPILPPKDIIHRIYRDVRFSSDKTPYKKHFSFSTSRSGRKGIWAGYYLAVAPGHSVIAAGVWMPGKDELAQLRHSFKTQPERFRREIEKPAFVELFGPARPHTKGKRQNVYGHDDALKVAPKGVDKTHKDIDLLKLRSVAVVHQFKDDEVLDPEFMETIKRIVGVMAPFVHLVNEFMTLPNGNGGATADNDDEADDGQDGDEGQ